MIRSLIVTILLISVMVLSSCKAQKEITRSTSKDSIVYREKIVYKDSLITLPGDSILVQVPCDTDTIIQKKGKTAGATVQVKNKVVTIRANCDEQNVKITKLETHISELETKSHEKDTIKEVPVRYIPDFYKYTTIAFWAAVAGIIIYKLRKFIV